MSDDNKKKKYLKWLYLFASFWIPFLGIIMFFINRKENPKEARIYAILSVLGFALNYCLLSKAGM